MTTLRADGPSRLRFLLWVVLGVPGTAFLASTTGCVSVGLDRYREVSIPYTDVETLDVSVEMGPGQLILQGGNEDSLALAECTSNVERWAPQVAFNMDEKHHGVLRVWCEGGFRLPAGNAENRWNLNLTPKAPLDLVVDMSVGEQRLDLRHTQLKRARVRLGVGELRLNLCRSWRHNVQVSVEVGIGDLRVVVPRGIGVAIYAENGLGSQSLPGFREEGDHWVNEAFGTSSNTVTLHLSVDVGELRVEEKDEGPPGEELSLLTKNRRRLRSI